MDEDIKRLYRGAASACLAAFQSGEHLWAEAESAYRSVTPSRLNCIDIAAFGLLERLVVAHQTNPEGTFEAVTTPSNAERPPCPIIGGLDPIRGRPGTQVTITGSNLGRVEDVEIEYDNGDVDDAVQFTRRDGSLVLTVEGTGGSPSGRACIILLTNPNWRVAGALFTLEASSPTPTGTPRDFSCPPN